MVRATIKNGAHGGVDVYVLGRYWSWFPSYDAAAEECNNKGYTIWG